MKKYIYAACVAVFILMSVLLAKQFQYTRQYRELYVKELQNVNAYRVKNSDLEKEIKVFKMTIDELCSSKDSLDIKLSNTMNELNIANNKVRSLQYQLKYISKTDTVVLHDTVFMSNVHVDTLFGDKWFGMRLQMEYPSTIITTPSFNSEQFVYIYNKKEYVGGKSKCFLINLFKKKYTSTEVRVEEKNPYIKTISQKFIEIM